MDGRAAGHERRHAPGPALPLAFRNLLSFVESPHSAIDGPAQGDIINLTDRRADRSRSAQLDLLMTLGPDRIVRELGGLEPQEPSAQGLLPHLIMPANPEVRSSDVST
jgi:hypothetical protein